MNTFLIFSILFCAILFLLYPIIRIAYFISSKKNKRNKILNLVIFIISFVTVYLIIRIKIKNIININLGTILNARKEIVFAMVVIIIGSILETIINTFINFFINRRSRNR